MTPRRRAPKKIEMPQLLVVGMHHSGTSIVAHMTMAMGFYGGERGELILRSDNPRKYWERRDVVALNQQWLDAARARGDDDDDGVPSWLGAHAPDPRNDTLYAEGVERILRPLLRVSANLTIKDPRLSLLLSPWIRRLPSPACVIVLRHPIALADSLHRYAPAVPTARWARLHALYYARIARECASVPSVVVEHEDLRSDPYGVYERLRHFARRLGAAARTIGRDALEAQVPPQMTPAAPATTRYEEEVASDALWRWRALRGGDLVATSSWATASGTAAPAYRLEKRNETYATLLTRDDPAYVRAACVLGASIRATDASRDMIALVLPSVRARSRRALAAVGWVVEARSPMREIWWGKCAGRATRGQTRRWGSMMSKLWLWRLPYARVHYVDADGLLLRPAAEYAASPPLLAERGRRPPLFNAGVLSLAPDPDVVRRVLALERAPPPRLFPGVVDCTEQAALNVVFGPGTPPLPSVRADDPMGTRSVDAVAVHWITHVCPKPWSLTRRPPSTCDARAYALWARYARRVDRRGGRGRRGSPDPLRPPRRLRLLTTALPLLVAMSLCVATRRRRRRRREGGDTA